MTKRYAIIADIAGQFDALMRLVAKIPKDCEIVLLGDLIDRGPDSDKVVQWAIDNNLKCCYANHEDMMVQGYDRTDYNWYENWVRNGGHATLAAYEGKKELALKHIEWFKSLPKLIRLSANIGTFRGLVVTHAPISRAYDDEFTYEDVVNDVNNPFMVSMSVIWSRKEPRQREFLQVSGHNSHWGYREFRREPTSEIFAYCLDQSKDWKLTAMLVPEMTLIEEDYSVPLKARFEDE